MIQNEDIELEPVCVDDIKGKDVYQPIGYFLPSDYRALHKRMLDMKIRRDDVWVVTHPKCGTTWVSEMVWLLRHNLDFEGAKTELTKRVPFIEHESFALRRLNDRRKEDPTKTIPSHFCSSFAFVDQWEESNGPRTIKSHLGWHLLPRELRKPDTPAKIVYVAREPKDTCISYYHHQKLLESFKGTLDEFIELFLSGRYNCGPYWEHVLEFWNRRNQPNILFLKYEDMKRDLPSAIRQVNVFLNLPPLSEDQVQRLVDHLSFDKMKDNDAVNMKPFIQSMQEVGVLERDLPGRFIRKGVVGDWKETMSQESVRRFDEWSAKKSAGSGLKF